MKTLNIDLETYSSVDLTKGGVYKYCESPDFQVLLFGYSVDGGEVQVIDLANGEQIPATVLTALADDAVVKWAYNATFERICLSRHLGLQPGQYLDPASWRCSMVWAATLGLPLSLAAAGAVLGLAEQKLGEGKDLIRYFCTPRSTGASGRHPANQGDLFQTVLPPRRMPTEAPDKWARFKEYNARDVAVEMAIQARLAKFPVADAIWAEYHLDQAINDRGVLLDVPLVEAAIKVADRSRLVATERLLALTELQNPNSAQQMKGWLATQGINTDSLDKKAVAEMLTDETPEYLAEVLALRQLLAKSSVKKYEAMDTAACSDGRARGMAQFYGANRTGRWAGRLIQIQNLPQNHLPDLEPARALVAQGNFEALDMLYDSVPKVLSELIRTAFIPTPGRKFIVSDFSAIEARVIAWLAGETWRNQVFATHGKIYEASAAQMFRVPIAEVTKGSDLRAKAKIAELALGYGGSVGALRAMGALDMSLKEPELQPLVNAWRNANPNIVKLWWAVGKAVVTAVRDGTTTETNGIKFAVQSGILFITLPSGRKLAYLKPRLTTNQYGSGAVTYEGVGATKKWERLESYGPKFVENIVQAIARDVLAEAMQRLSRFDIVMTVHDEIVIEAEPETTVAEICELMAITPSWAPGLLLRADGFKAKFYQK
jgi:DNA polymerase bacteriophage-type